MNYICKKRGGLSLSETLFTLAVVGTVMSLTFFGIFIKINHVQNMAALQKIYSAINQVTFTVFLDRSSAEYWGLDNYSQDSSALAYSYYKPYFKIIRECAAAKGCWHYPSKYLSGNVYLKNSRDYQYMFTLADGMNVIINVYPKDIVAEHFGVNVKTDSVVFLVDVNGDAYPNQVGRDIFAFVLDGNKIVPGGTDNSFSCNRAASGLTCAARAINDGWQITYY